MFVHIGNPDHLDPQQTGVSCDVSASHDVTIYNFSKRWQQFHILSNNMVKFKSKKW